MHRFRLSWVSISLGFWLAACGTEAPAPADNAAADAGADASGGATDAGADVGGTDVGADTGTDAATDDAASVDADDGASDDGASDDGTSNDAVADIEADADDIAADGADGAGGGSDADDALDGGDGGEDDASPDADDAADTAGDASDAGEADATEDAGDAQDVADIDPGPQPCSPPLTISPANATVLPYDLQTFVAKGGTGTYTFTLKTNASGAIINEYAGTYLSGEKSGVTDVVHLEDAGCIGTATATVAVVAPMIVEPLEVKLAPGKGFTYSAKKGSGEVAFELTAAPSGGTIDAKTGTYVAGIKSGVDLVTVTDKATGETVTAKVLVVAGAKLVASPARVVLGVGSSATLGAVSGSGHLAFSGGTGVVQLDPKGVITAVSPGATNIDLVDGFTGEKAKVAVQVVARQDIDDGVVGDGTQQASLAPCGDLDGDGREEIAHGLPEADNAYFNAGSVTIWRSTATGVAATPWVRIDGQSREERLGWSLLVAAVGKGGAKQLLIGAPLADVGLSNNGGVQVHDFQANGKPKQAPSQTLGGAYAGDQLGYALAACDFNADGLLDLAVGAPYAEDRSGSTVVSDQGGVFVYLGGPTGLPASPSFARFGVTPDGKGGFAAQQNARFGWSLAAGDFDGDGACDLAVGSLYYKVDNANDGAVLVYRGQKASGGDVGGLQAQPAFAASGAGKGEVGAQFGRSIAACDTDGDGKAELLVGSLNYRAGDAKFPGRGGTHLFAGLKLGKPADALAGIGDAAKSWVGAKSYDNHGYRVACTDVTGDGVDDVLTQIHNGEVDGGVANVGVLAVHAGAKGKLPAATPTREEAGEVGGDSFGLAVAPIDDRDGDGKPEWFVHAGLADPHGYNAGAAYVVRSKDASRQTLALPGKASGARFGSALAFVGDLDGDGRSELAVGGTYASPTADGKPTGTRSGVVWLYRGTAGGADFAKGTQIAGFPGHSGSDYFGWWVDRAGDTDGDGVPDVAVLARAEDRPGNFSSTYSVAKACGGSRSNVGAVYVFRGTKTASVQPTPSLVAYGPQVSQYGDTVLGDLDVDGDGKKDLVLGGVSWDAPSRSNAGGWGLIRGRSAVEGKTVVVCEPDTVVFSDKANDNLGRALARLGDLDGDGCDEFAVGASGADNGLTNQGAVHVVFGFGAGCKSTKPRQVVLAVGTANAAAGWSLDGGHDVDGDGKNDLVVGGVNLAIAGATVGGVWVVRGAWLAAQTPALIVDGQAPVVVSMADPKETASLSVFGTAPGGRFGASVALVPGYESDGRAAILVGAPLGAHGGTALAGGAELFRFSKTAGLLAEPLATWVGDSARPGANSGWAVAAGIGKPNPVAAVGSLYGTPAGGKPLDQGDVLVAPTP
ncbi:MAG: hypothetical protein RIT45_863 [Pseudomonadota bacterium]